jgi:hypothetical protein
LATNIANLTICFQAGLEEFRPGDRFQSCEDFCPKYLFLFYENMTEFDVSLCKFMVWGQCSVLAKILFRLQKISYFNPCSGFLHFVGNDITQVLHDALIHIHHTCIPIFHVSNSNMSPAATRTHTNF